MTTAGAEALPTEWNDDRDGAFFRITATLFPSAFVGGASVLLAGYDDDCESVASTASDTAPVSTEGLTARASISGAWTS